MRPKTPPSPSAPPSGIRLFVLGLAILAAALFFLLLGLGQVAGLVLGPILLYLFGFTGSGLLAAVLLNRIFDKRDSREEDRTWF